MNPAVSAEILLEHLDQEKKVLTALLSFQKDVYRCVSEHDWVQLNQALESCNSCTAAFERLEAHRADLTGTDLNSFYEFSGKYKTADRTRLNNSFRELKQLFTVSRAEHESLETYISHITTLLNGFFDAVMPVRRNKIYSRSGSVVPRSIESLVLNRAL